MKMQLAMVAGALIVTAQVHASLSSFDTGAGLYGDGVGTIDPNWTASLAAGSPNAPGPITGSTYLVPNGTTYNANGGTYALVPGAWAANTLSSSWISYYSPPTLPDENGETIQYQLQFNAASAGLIGIQWWSDNSSTLLVNGIPVGLLNNNTFTTGTSVSGVSLNQGLNTIDVDVFNAPQGQPDWGNPEGVRVEFSGDVSAVPEASTMLAGALMLLPFGMSAVRIMRRKVLA